MLPQCSHITRKRGVYYYRRRLPGLVKGEVTISLRTRSFREAQWLGARMDQEFGRIKNSVTSNTPAPDIGRIVREYLKGKLAFDMEQRAGSPNQPVYSGYCETGDDIVAADLKWVGAELETAETELTERLYEHQRPLIDELMQGNAIPVEYRNALTHAVFEANVKIWETIRERTLGNFSSEPRDVEHIPSDKPRQATVEAVPASPPLSEILPGFLDFMSKDEGWRGQTLAQNTAPDVVRILPSHVRRGLLRLYLAIAVPWAAWFGYQILYAFQHHSYGYGWRYASGAFRTLLIVPIGGPILFFVIVWIIAGFRKFNEATPQPEPPSQPSTVDYYGFISRAVAELNGNATEVRDALYDRARTALVAQPH